MVFYFEEKMGAIHSSGVIFAQFLLNIPT